MLYYLQAVLGHLVTGILEGGSSFIASTSNFWHWLYHGFIDAILDFLPLLFI